MQEEEIDPLQALMQAVRTCKTFRHRVTCRAVVGFERMQFMMLNSLCCESLLLLIFLPACHHTV